MNFLLVSDHAMREYLQVAQASNFANTVRSKTIADVSAGGAYAEHAEMLLNGLRRETKRFVKNVPEIAVIPTLSGETTLMVLPGRHALQFIIATWLGEVAGLPVKVMDFSELTDGVVIAVGSQTSLTFATLTILMAQGVIADVVISGDAGEVVSLRSGVIGTAKMTDFDLTGWSPRKVDFYSRALDPSKD